MVLLYYFVSLSSISSYNRKNQQQAKSQKDRKKHLEKNCEQYHDNLEHKYKEFKPQETFYSIVRTAVLLHNPEIPFLWCMINKAASQSWTDLFISAW